jgi:pimeloyl-ACP methyl ester carboxylesterase
VISACLELGYPRASKELLINQLNTVNIKIGEGNVSYLCGGTGDPLVIVHGGGGGANAWKKSLEILAENYTVYAPDLPGFGRSQSIHDRFMVSEYVDFLEDFTSALGLEDFYLVGHSVGGGLALSYALDHPRKVKRLVLVSSLFLGSEIALWARYLSTPKLTRYLGEAGLTVFDSMSRLAGHVGYTEKITPPFTRVQMAIGRGIMNLKGQTNILADRLMELMMPTLLVWGARDPIVPARHAWAAADIIPDCRVHVFEGCGHHVQNRKEFTSLLLSFLGKHPDTH